MRFGPNMRINRKHHRVLELLAHVMRAIEPHLKESGETNHHHEVARDLEDLFDATGAYIVTDAMRAEAGLSIRNSDGLTYEELMVIEARMMAGLLSSAPPHVRSAIGLDDIEREKNQ